MLHTPLHTNRLTLRPMHMRDIDAIHALAGDWHIAKSCPNIPHPYPRRAAIALITCTRSNLNNGTAYVLAITHKGQLIGCIGLTLEPAATHPQAELGYWLGRCYWGQGYATEAAQRLLHFGFADLNLQRVDALCFADNNASRRVLAKIGMVHEDTLTQHHHHWGEWKDCTRYGLHHTRYLIHQSGSYRHQPHQPR